MKRMLTAAVAMTLTLSLGASALAYSGTITLNGTKLDTSKLPDAPAGSVIPLRTVAEADYGFADWYADENRSFFSLDGNSISDIRKSMYPGQDGKKARSHSRSMCRFRSADQASFWVRAAVSPASSTCR